MLHSVAAIIITCDRPLAILDRAASSVINQTHCADEIVIVYTGSSDSIYEKICETYKTAKIFRTQGLSSGAIGRNMGVTLTQSDYIAFLDDDDEWFPDKLENQLSCIEDDVSMVISPYMIMHQDGTLKQFERFDKLSNIQSIIGENVVGCTSFPLLSRDAFNEAGGFDPDFAANQEWDLWMRIILKNRKITSCKAPAGIKYESKESISANVSKRMSGWWRMFRKHFHDMLNSPSEGANATEFWWREAYNSHKYATLVFALSFFVFFKVLSRIRT